MSSMLEQAIIDAEALREVALKNAESAVIEKYSSQIKEAVEDILTNSVLKEEEEEEESEIVSQVDFAAADDGHECDEDCGCPDEEEEIVLDLTDLLTQMKDDDASGALDADDMEDREDTAEEIVTETEEIELDESALESLLEEEEEEEGIS